MTTEIIKLKLALDNYNLHDDPSSCLHAFLNLQYRYYSSNKLVTIEELNWLEDCVYEILMKQLTEKFRYILVFIADVSKFNDRSDIIAQILNYLPSSTDKFRLDAYVHYRRIDDIKVDLINVVDNFFHLINLADASCDEDISNDLIDDILQFYLWGTDKLTSKGYLSEAKAFTNKFIKADIKKYPLLGDPRIILSLDKESKPLNIDLRYTNTSTYQPSNYMEAFFELRLIQPIKNLPETKLPNKILGFDKSYIRREVLEYGLTDFDLQYNDITSECKVLLYNYFNLRKHYFTFYHIISSLDNLSTYYSSFDPIIIDLGCGPGTAGLAFVESYFQSGIKPKFKYIGVDISKSMLNTANENIKYLNLNKCDIEPFFSKSIDLDLIKSQINPTSMLIFTASYLFASGSLDESKLALSINELLNTYKEIPVVFIFQNTQSVDKNIKYHNFKKKLIGLNVKISKSELIYYKTKRKMTFEPSSETCYYEILLNSKFNLD
jgi:hypothetical protein